MRVPELLLVATRFLDLPPPRRLRRWLQGVALALLTGCASLEGDGQAESDRINGSPWARANALPVAGPSAGWVHQRIAGREASRYTPVDHLGRPAIRARSTEGDSVLRMPLLLDGVPAGHLHFSWFVNELNTTADLEDRALDDAVVRVILYFDGDRSRFSARDQRLSEWIQLATGEPLPYASLVYVWDHRHPADTVLRHPRTDRIKTIVAESGPAQLGHWVDIQRNVHDDYTRAFGKPPQRLVGIALMTDANNTGRAAEGWYGPLRWKE